MRFDTHSYTVSIDEGKRLAYALFEASYGLYNRETGFDMIYQENKVFNLKLAAKTLNGLLIKPGETFSFWWLVRNADKRTPYKDGLTVTNGKLGAAYGGGLCQMSNLLFWVFLHSPLTIVERHAHKTKDFPTLRKDAPEGVDATIKEGWLDLRVKNETDITFQIDITFDNQNIYGRLFADRDLCCSYKIEGENHKYFRKEGEIFESISIYRCCIPQDGNKTASKSLLYENLCKIGYQLPEGTKISEGVG
jgi:vancomycin resistance protein VanW